MYAQPFFTLQEKKSRGLAPKTFHISRSVVSFVEILPQCHRFRNQQHWCVLKFCQFDKISIRTCVFAYTQLRLWPPRRQPPTAFSSQFMTISIPTCTTVSTVSTEYQHFVTSSALGMDKTYEWKQNLQPELSLDLYQLKMFEIHTCNFYLLSPSDKMKISERCIFSMNNIAKRVSNIFDWNETKASSVSIWSAFARPCLVPVLVFLLRF